MRGEQRERLLCCGPLPLQRQGCRGCVAALPTNALLLSGRRLGQQPGAPPIMMPMADSVGQSWLFFSQKRSSRMVNSSVKRRSAMNMGTFRPAVPAGRVDQFMYCA